MRAVVSKTHAYKNQISCGNLQQADLFASRFLLRPESQSKSAPSIALTMSSYGFRI